MSNTQPELKATRPGVAKRRWLANQDMRILRLPIKLRAMILEQVFLDTGTWTPEGRLSFVNGGWAPPPILQTCKELRTQGIPMWLKLPGVFHLHDYHSKDIINREKWAVEMEKYFNGKPDCANLGVQICGWGTRDKVLETKNLLAWAEFFFETGACGVFPSGDVDDEVKAKEQVWWPVSEAFPATMSARLGKLFIQVYRLSRCGLTWDVVKPVIVPAIDLLVLW